MDFRGDFAAQGIFGPPGRRPSLAARAAALLRRARLDRSLAEGRDPTTPASRWRARQLTGRHTRRRLAERLVRLSATAERPPRHPGSAVPVNRHEIRRASRLMRELAAELVAAGPVTARGVLRLRGLLHDGSSPIYARAPDGALELELRHARTTLFLL